MNATVANYDAQMRALHIGLTFSATIFGIIGLLFLFLFFYYPPQRANLWFGLHGLSVATFIFLVRSRATGTQGAGASIVVFDFAFVATTAIGLCLLAFLYTQFEARLTWRFYSVVLLQVFIVSQVLFPLQAGFTRLIFLVGSLVYPLEWLRIIVRAIGRKETGAIAIGIGVLLYCINPLAVFLQEIGAIHSGLQPARQFAGLTLNVLIAAFLARNFARTNHNLETQLEQVMRMSVKELEHERAQAELRVQREQERARLAEVEAENECRAQELEEARQLQLSMLPKKLPNLPHLDIAAYMKTASEVGGDYYDFHTSDDGTLTVAIGDATGHGLKAGTMVASVKSLFISLAYHPDIPHIFTRMSQTLKQMQMRGVFMALAMVKTAERRVNIAIAGMPPIMLYRHAANTVERINLTGLPLGSITSYHYREMTTEMQPGDVLLMLSDGLTELFNPADEMFGEERVEQCLQTCAQGTPEEIIARLLAEAETWAEGRKLDDDLTLVVLKAK